MITTLVILAISAVFFAMGKVRSDLVALCALVALLLTGILTPQEALSGFSNSVVIMMVGLFVVGGAIVQTGLAKKASGKLMTLADGNEQHGHGGADDAYRGESGAEGRHKGEPSAHAARLRKQHGRYAHAHRYAAQPCYSGSADRGGLRTAQVLQLSARGRCLHHRGHRGAAAAAAAEAAAETEATEEAPAEA